jgi:hypothetical protein
MKTAAYSPKFRHPPGKKAGQMLRNLTGDLRTLFGETLAPIDALSVCPFFLQKISFLSKYMRGNFVGIPVVQ